MGATPGGRLSPNSAQAKTTCSGTNESRGAGRPISLVDAQARLPICQRTANSYGVFLMRQTQEVEERQEDRIMVLGEDTNGGMRLEPLTEVILFTPNACRAEGLLRVSVFRGEDYRLN